MDDIELLKQLIEVLLEMVSELMDTKSRKTFSYPHLFGVSHA